MVRGAAVATSASVPAAFLLLLPMEAGVPIPIPADLVMLLFGERVADGSFPLWAAVAALEIVAVAGSTALFLFARGPGHALVTRIGPRFGLTPARLDRAVAMIEQRGRAALVVGRATPGLRTVTTVAAGASGLSARRALPALVLGASVFLQLHLVLGYFLGPAARDALEEARRPALAVLAVVVAAALLYWFARRRNRISARAGIEGACPVCVALGWAVERYADRHRPVGAHADSTV